MRSESLLRSYVLASGINDICLELLHLSIFDACVCNLERRFSASFRRCVYMPSLEYGNKQSFPFIDTWTKESETVNAHRKPRDITIICALMRYLFLKGFCGLWKVSGLGISRQKRVEKMGGKAGSENPIGEARSALPLFFFLRACGLWLCVGP